MSASGITMAWFLAPPNAWMRLPCLVPVLSLADVPMGDGTLTVSAWGKNLLDEEYRINTIPFIIWTVSYFGQPQTYGLDVTYQF
jgi:hypothetical protein